MGDRPRVVESVGSRRSGKVAQNAPVDHAALTPAEAETLTPILQKVVEQGTGTRAQLPGRAVAGKTGTTDDYGDAWFVGYTPELVTAVWVGYPNELKPMETEFHGEPVAGGTLPALIWKAFMGRALAGTPTTSFASPPYLPTYGARVVFRERRVAARQRLLPGDARHQLLRRPPARLDGDVLRERGVRAGASSVAPWTRHAPRSTLSRWAPT